LFLAHHENPETTKVTNSFRKSNIDASVQTPNGHEGIEASSNLLLYPFGQVGLTGERDDVSCE
jgi:hypothetical protein